MGILEGQSLQQSQSQCVRSYHTSFSGYLALSILLHQVLQVEVHVVFAQYIVAGEQVPVIYLDLESTVVVLFIEFKYLIKENVFPASLHREHYSSVFECSIVYMTCQTFGQLSRYPCMMCLGFHFLIVAAHKGVS